MLFTEKYIKDFDLKKVSSYLKHWDVNNSYEWAISQKLSIGGLNLKKI